MSNTVAKPVETNDTYWLTHPRGFTIEKVKDASVSRSIFLEKNSSTLPVSSDAKFVASRLNGGRYETLMTDTYTKFGVKLLEGSQDNDDMQLQSRGTVLTELLSCDGLRGDKTPKRRLAVKTEFNAQKCLEETVFTQVRVWAGNKYGLRSSMTRALLRYFHHAIPLGLNLKRFYAIFVEVTPKDIETKARTYILDGHARYTAYAQAINIIYNNYQTENGKVKRISKAHSSYVRFNYLPHRADARRVVDDE